MQVEKLLNSVNFAKVTKTVSRHKNNRFVMLLWSPQKQTPQKPVWVFFNSRCTEWSQNSATTFSSWLH